MGPDPRECPPGRAQVRCLRGGTLSHTAAGFRAKRRGRAAVGTPLSSVKRLPKQALVDLLASSTRKARRWSWASVASGRAGRADDGAAAQPNAQGRSQPSAAAALAQRRRVADVAAGWRLVRAAAADPGSFLEGAFTTGHSSPPRDEAYRAHANVATEAARACAQACAQA